MKEDLGMKCLKVAPIPVPPKKTVEEHAREQAAFLKGCNWSPAFGEVEIVAGLMARGSDKATFLADNVGNHTHTFPNQEGRDS